MSAMTPRVLLVDDDTPYSELLAGRLASRGCAPLCAKGIGDALVKDAGTKAAAFYPHAIVLDWRLHGAYSEYSACERLLEALPSCGKLVHSGWPTLEEANRVKDHYHVQVLDKRNSPDRILEVIQQVVTEQCGFGWRLDDQLFDVQWPENWPRRDVLKRVFGPETSAPEDLLDSLIWQLFNPSAKGDERNVARVTLLELDGSVHSPRPPSPGHAVVLAANLDHHQEPVVTKIAEKSHIERERRNFDKYVDRNVLGGYYSHLRSHAYFHDLGALEYTLVTGPLTGVTSFAAWYHANDTVQKTVKPLRHFFGTAWCGHYRNSQPYNHPLEEYDRTRVNRTPRPAGWQASLYELYDPSLRLSERIDAFPDQRATQPAPGLPGFELPNPMTWLQRHWKASVVPGARVAITHGDLHGGNLLVDAEHGWAIDFERTGWGHWLRDFVELEVDLVTRLMALPDDSELDQFVRLAVVLVSKLEPDSQLIKLAAGNAASAADNGAVSAAGDIAKVVKVVTALRRIMNEVAKPSDIREYLWGLLLDAAFAAAWAPPDSEPRRRALVLGAVICNRLEHMSGRWPLRDKVLFPASSPGRQRVGSASAMEM